MKFEELEARLRIFETAHDQWVLPGIYKTNTPAVAQRRRLKIDWDLPMRSIYDEYIKRLLEASDGAHLGRHIDGSIFQ